MTEYVDTVQKIQPQVGIVISSFTTAATPGKAIETIIDVLGYPYWGIPPSKNFRVSLSVIGKDPKSAKLELRPSYKLAKLFREISDLRDFQIPRVYLRFCYF
ncbi:MAG: hypothetical protein IH899_06930 [Planctomycetes bacterium]|nr:hypothetical protein [Planctomycetota bacterium]